MRGDSPGAISEIDAELMFAQMRGDSPVRVRHFIAVGKFAPHAWGFTRVPIAPPDAELVRPTFVGVHLAKLASRGLCERSPHARGGLRCSSQSARTACLFAPRAWGFASRVASGLSGDFLQETAIRYTICSMAFRFIHTADWQIGKVVRFLGGAEMGGLQLARLEAITRVGNLADEHDVRHILVAGDVYDHATPCLRPRNSLSPHATPGRRAHEGSRLCTVAPVAGES